MDEPENWESVFEEVRFVVFQAPCRVGLSALIRQFACCVAARENALVRFDQSLCGLIHGRTV